MPTENRSSNTDLRDVFIRLNPLGLGEAELRKDSTGFEDQRTHSDYLLFLAGYRETHPEPQPHPEPIAWMVGTAFWWTKEEAERDAATTGLPIVGLGPMSGIDPDEQHQGEPVALPGRATGFSDVASGWNKCLDRIETLGPLYAHADPNVRWKAVADEQMQVIEGLQRRIQNAYLALKVQTQNCETLRAQLAGAQTLLREVHAGMWPSNPLTIRIGNALSASAEPSNDLCEEGAHDFVPFRRECVRCGEPFSAEPSAPGCDHCAGAGHDYYGEKCAHCKTSAPVGRDERADFEKEFAAKGRPLTRADYDPDAYGNPFDDGAWAGWQARAALERKPS